MLILLSVFNDFCKWRYGGIGDQKLSRSRLCCSVFLFWRIFFQKMSTKMSKKGPGASRNAFSRRLATNRIQSTEHKKCWFYLGVSIIFAISKATLSARIRRFAGHLCKLGWCLGRFWVLCVVACFVMSAILGIFISRATLAWPRAISWRLLGFMLGCVVGSVRLSLNLCFQERFCGSIHVCLLWGFCPQLFALRTASV